MSEHSTRPRVPMTPRHVRALSVLLAAGEVTREDFDAIVGVSNGPDEIMKLRRRFELDIPCERRPGRDRDGRSVEFGVYWLTPIDRRRVLELLNGGQP